MAEATPPDASPDDLAALLEAPGEIAQSALRNSGPRSFLGAIRLLHEQHETARRARNSLARRRIAVSGKMARSAATLTALIHACGAHQVGISDDWNMLVVGTDPSKRALGRAARDGVAVIAEDDLAAMYGVIDRFERRSEASRATAIERARHEARQQHQSNRRVSASGSTPAQLDDVAERLIRVARDRQKDRGSGMHTHPAAVDRDRAA